MKQFCKVVRGGCGVPIPTMNLQFGYEYDEILSATGEEGATWIKRIKWLGPYVVMVWIVATHKTVPSDNGIMVWGREGTYRLGDLAMLVKPEWNNAVTVIMLQSSRQKAWLHGMTFPTTIRRIDETNMDQL
jgi:hypothetical protein